MQLRYGAYVGRVGALAVALGIGSAVAAPAGVAWAAPDDGETSSAVDTSAPANSDTGGGAGETAPDSVDPVDPDPVVDTPAEDTPAEQTPEPAPGSDADDSAQDDEDDEEPARKRSADRVAAPGDASVAQAPAERSLTTSATAEPADSGAPAVTPAEVSVAATQQPAIPAPVVPDLAKPVVAKQVQTVGTLIADAVRPVLSAFLGLLPNGSTDSPLAWALLAAARRQLGVPEAEAFAGRPLAATQTVAAAAVANQPPSATVVWGRPDATTGAVVGKVTAADPEGKKVTVALAPNQNPGALAFNTKTGVITYTPTTAQRFAAQVSETTEDTISISLRVTDGVNVVAVPVSIPVTPAQLYRSGSLSGVTDPSAVAVAGTRAYVTNRATGTVTVYDTTTNTLVATYQTGVGSPDGIAAKPDGSRLYVSSSTDGKVTVIDTKTGTLKATLNIAGPTAITIAPNGSTVYVAGGDGAVITKINTSTNKVAGTVRLSAGLRPTELLVSADGKKVYVAATTATGGQVVVFNSNASTATKLADIGSAPTGFALNAVHPRLYVTDLNGTVTVVDTTMAGAPVTVTIGVPLTGVAISKDSSTLMVTTSIGPVVAVGLGSGSIISIPALRDAAAPPVTVQPAVVLSADGTRMFVTDLDADTTHVMSLVPPNTAPFSSDPQYRISNPATGAVTGRVGVVDYDGDPLTHVLTGKPAKGKLALNADGTYIYTPTAAARHAASVPNAPTSATTDSFTVVVSDGRYGTLTQTITIAISPINNAPTVSTTVGNPSTSNGAVKVTIKTADADKDARTLTLTGAPTKGVLVSTGTGAYTYIPDAAARAAASLPGAPLADRMDTFTVTVNDGHGGVVPVTVNVRIGAANVRPVWANPVVASPDSRTGEITGTFTATDANGDVLSYTAGKTAKGTLTINSDGTFVYTPNTAARLAASKPKAAAAAKSETINITVGDGFGGTTTASLKVAIAPNPTTNAAPTNGQATVLSTSTAIGTVTGTVSADDADGDKLTYSLKSGPRFGVAKVSSTGGFTYTPDVDARYRALITDGADTDSFEVTITDSFGGITTATVDVTVAPPSPSAIDQRGTTVAVNTQNMYFYSQADTDKALGLLKDAGVDTIRIALPWALVETEDGTFDWTAVDRIVDSANAHGIKVLATINTTPDWAATPGQPQYAGAPADPQAYGEFVTAVALRYQGRVTDYQIWNEPNYNGFWAPTPDAKQYTELLKVAYTAIKAVDADAMVVAGSVAFVAETPGGAAVNPVTYMSAMYAAGAGGYFDALAFHPYLYTVSFSAGEGRAGVPFAQAQQLYALMVANGDGNKKIWATEYGQPDSEGGEDLQAAFVGDFLRAWRSLDFAGPAFLHTIADAPHEIPHEASFGLFRQDWTPKPVVAVVTQVILENQAINAATDADVL